MATKAAMAGISDGRSLAVGVVVLLAGCTQAAEDGFGFDGGPAGAPGAGAGGDTEDPDGPDDPDPSGSETGGADSGAGTFGELDDTGAGDESGAVATGDTGGGAADDATTGETVDLGGGCDAGATTVVSNQIITAIYNGSMRSPGSVADDPHGSIWIAAPGDLCGLSITLQPDAGTDAIEAVLRDPADIAVAGASCTAAAGQPCTIDLADGPGEPMALRLEVRDGVDGMLGSLRIDLSATTEGLATAVPIDGTFRGAEDTDFVLWPVGPATGGYAYEWSTDSAPAYNVGVISASGALTPAMNTTNPNLASFPATGNPHGWYVFAASTTDDAASGDAWAFNVVP